MNTCILYGNCISSDIVSSIDTEGDSGKRDETDIEAMDTAERFPGKDGNLY